MDELKQRCFKDLPLKVAYDSGAQDILWDFYIPVLSKASKYDRIAGFFSSSTLALTAKGFGSFLNNDGKMRLVTCPQLSSNDLQMLETVSNNIDEILTKNFINEYSQIESQFQKDHVQALGWMLAHEKLEIKIAVVKKNGKVCSREQIEQMGIMHQKVGILYDDEDNVISFSGSNNESASGWRGNTEEFKVFKSWTSANEYVQEDIRKFESFWYGSRPDVEVMDIPEAIKKQLIIESKDFKEDLLSISHYYPEKDKKEKQKLQLFYYQNAAVDKWEQNSRSLLLQMATGCGKTRTAIACMNNALNDTNKLLVVIACPQATLASQWKNDIASLELIEHQEIEINGTVHNWEGRLTGAISKLGAGFFENLVVYVTHDTCSSDKFINIINGSNSKITKFLIGDEVHGLGAQKRKKALLECYKYRLGLSATPQRWFDDVGSDLIVNYFGNDSFEFSIHDALININPYTGKTFLVNFTYEPRFVSLTEIELQEYKKLTDKIKKIGNMDNEETKVFLEMMRFQRANIEKNAENKYQRLEQILDEIGPAIDNTIIFVSPQQIDEVMKILSNRHIRAAKFTEKQSTVPSVELGGKSEREYIIDLFKEKKYKVLVAIKCLDEGIDIPSADTAIVMASSTNPREYVQRIGRIIRQARGKYHANIYDLIIEPACDAFSDGILKELEIRIFKKEMDRVLDLSSNALNSGRIINLVYDKLEEFKL